MKNEKENMASKETELNLEEVGNEIVGGTIGDGSYTVTAVAGVKKLKVDVTKKKKYPAKKHVIDAGDAVHAYSDEMSRYDEGYQLPEFPVEL